jgi:hypothetical protein
MTFLPPVRTPPAFSWPVVPTWPPCGAVVAQMVRLRRVTGDGGGRGETLNHE